MTTAIDQVRALDADPYQYDRTTDVADGVATDFQTANYPVFPLSEKVYINGALKVRNVDYTIDNDTGVISFTAVPTLNANVVVTYKWSILSDASLQVMLDLVNANVLLGAAMALDTIASSETLIQKVITLLDLTTDGSKVAASLRAHALELRDQNAQGLATGSADDVPFDWAEQVFDQATFRERLIKSFLRSGI